MRKQVSSLLWLGLLAAICALVVVGFWQVRKDNPLLFALERHPQGIMGTTCQIKAVVPADQTNLAEQSLDAAEAALRTVEACMSPYINSSEIYSINAVEAGQAVSVSPRTLEVLTLSRELTSQTSGAFNVTFAPVFELWKTSAMQNRIPTPSELALAKELSGWERFKIRGDSVVKLRNGAMIDLGGIAKGYGIDQAVQEMIAQGISGGLVNVGGDIRCFGDRPGGGRWRVSIQDPFSADDPSTSLGVLLLKGGAVCTSGSYRRFTEIGGKRYSHIVDPRTAQPVDTAPSVTVVAPRAALADAWATALSVLGPEGVDLIPADEGIQAMLLLGGETDFKVYKTPGFDDLVESPSTQPME